MKGFLPQQNTYLILPHFSSKGRVFSNSPKVSGSINSWQDFFFGVAYPSVLECSSEREWEEDGVERKLNEK